MSAARVEMLLRLADNALVLSQRLSEWCGKGPVLEEDLATTNTALDLIGQARMWFGYAGELEGRGRDEDAFAYRRDAHEFRNALLVEQPNGHYGDTIARQFYFDAFHLPLLRGLCNSADERVADIAAKSAKEVAYHLERSADWVIRLGDGTAQSHARMQRAVDDLWMYTGELFTPDAVDAEMAAAGLAPDLAELREPWLASVRKVFEEATLTVPGDAWMQTGGKQGVHTEKLGFLLAEMQYLQRAYPDARW
jgi:ring-1,2-phenylacetyl-CoA epoxidase subunit PaaC